MNDIHGDTTGSDPKMRNFEFDEFELNKKRILLN